MFDSLLTQLMLLFPNYRSLYTCQVYVRSTSEKKKKHKGERKTFPCPSCWKFLLRVSHPVPAVSEVTSGHCYLRESHAALPYLLAESTCPGVPAVPEVMWGHLGGGGVEGNVDLAYSLILTCVASDIGQRWISSSCFLHAIVFWMYYCTTLLIWDSALYSGEHMLSQFSFGK